MAEVLTLTTPVTTPDTTTWLVKTMFLDVDAPSVKIEIVSNLGEPFVWRYIVSDTVTEANVRAALSFINQGKFMVNQGKSLQRWILEQIAADQNSKAGTVSGAIE